MTINDSIIKDYLNDISSTHYKNHWIYYNIEPRKYLFETPDEERKSIISKIYVQILDALNHFKPLNESMFKVLFPNYKGLLEKLNVLLVVGCPSPYDAMFKEYKGRGYIVFDLIRFSDYVEQGCSIEYLIIQLITHEFAHQCINQEYPSSINMPYQEELSYVVFNEGIAHLLAFKDPIESINWESEEYSTHYENAKSKLFKALQETDRANQLELLEEADSGSYWAKFGAVVGKIYFGLNQKNLHELYQKGYKDIIQRIF